MKRSFSIILVAMVYACPQFSQTHLNLRYIDGTEKNLPFASLQKITFDESAGAVTFLLTDASTQTVTFASLQRMTSADAIVVSNCLNKSLQFLWYNNINPQIEHIVKVNIRKNRTQNSAVWEGSSYGK